jgi:hypothetical protein
MTALRTRAKKLATHGVVVCLVAGALALVGTTPASAASSLTVSTTADTGTNAGPCGSSSTSVPSPLSLRAAVCLANNFGGTTTIDVPVGRYTLTNGELQLGTNSGQDVTLRGASSAGTIIDGNNASRVLNLDPDLVGGVAVRVSNVTITGGKDETFGGAGIIGGSGDAATPDSLTIDNSVITGNVANAQNQDRSNNPGGGVQFSGGSLTITSSTISNNSSYSSAGSGVAFLARGVDQESLTVTGSTFSANKSSSSSSTGEVNGGALELVGAGSTPFSVTGSRFVGNTVTATTAGAAGAAIRQTGGTLTLSRSTFTGNSVAGNAVANGGAIEVASGSATLRYNRITGNTAKAGSAVHVGADAGTVDGALNWLGCNGGSGNAGCDTIVSDGAAVTQAPRLVLRASATPSTLTGPNATSTVTASLLDDSAGNAVAPSNLTAFDGQLVQWSAAKPALAAISANSSTVSGGTASVTYDSKTSSGVGSVSAALDQATVTPTITVQRPAAVTQDPSDLSIEVGQTATFTVATSGYPAPTVQWQRSTDGGQTYSDIDGAAATTYSFTAAGDDNANRYRAVATNGVGQPATSTSATLTVGGPATFTSSDSVTFKAGTAKSFTIATGGFPATSKITRSGALPSGLTFTDNGDGTATLAGTPAGGTGGSYPIVLTAENGRTPAGTQTLTVQVDEAPAVTTDPSDQTVEPGKSVTFTAAAAGSPTPTVQWQRSTDGGETFADLDGETDTSLVFAAARGSDGHRFRAVFTNTAGTATSKPATLRVGTAPKFTSAASATFAVGKSGSYEVTTSGVPNATITTSGTVPAWLTLTDNGDGTAELSGTPPTGSGGVVTVALKASNGFSPAATQTVTVTVRELASFTSADHTTFGVGDAGSFTVTTTAGYPASTAITKTGSLPSGVTLVDNHDGTATISGTPAAGSGGVYPVTLSATNGAGSRTQTFSLTVREATSISSADHATFAAGEAGTFTVTTAGGYPTDPELSLKGTLPSGLTFTDNGDGTATIEGTPTAADSGTTNLGIEASNGVAPVAKQTFALTVTSAPVFSSDDTAAFTIGSKGSFSVVTSGFPKASLTLTGGLPSGVTFTDNGDGTATLAGTPAAGSVGQYTRKVTATSSAGTTSQSLVVKVSKAAQAITVTSVAPASPVVGQTYTPAATADSGKAVAVTIDAATTASACSLTDGTVRFGAAGTCVIAYDQAGDDTYEAAPKVTQTLTVSKVATTLGVTTSVSPSVFGQSATATATVTHAGGVAAAGTVQFTVNGAELGSPVTVSSGTARSPELRLDGKPLTPGSHAVAATFTPTDAVRYDGATSSTTQVVDQAATTTDLTVGATTLTATVRAKAPGAGTPTGTVTFRVGGDEVGTAELVDGVATLKESVPSGLVRQVAAAYAGDTSFTGSSSSVTRNDPTITAAVSSARAKSKYGWYRSPVTITFTCTANGASLVEPCPAPVRLSAKGAGQSVTRTIAATDGGAATVVVGGINIDDQRPSVKIRGVKKGGVYGPKNPKATCVGKDSLSGIASCTITRRTRGTTVTLTATATDKAGNTVSTRVRYRTSLVTLEGAKFKNGAYDVRRGHTYTLVVHAGSRPRYYEAEVAPRTPHKLGGLMHRAGRDRYALGVTMKDLRGRTYWNLGVKIGKTMHIVRVRARG